MQTLKQHLLNIANILRGRSRRDEIDPPRSTSSMTSDSNWEQSEVEDGEEDDDEDDEKGSSLGSSSHEQKEIFIRWRNRIARRIEAFHASEIVGAPMKYIGVEPTREYVYFFPCGVSLSDDETINLQPRMLPIPVDIRIITSIASSTGEYVMSMSFPEIDFTRSNLPGVVEHGSMIIHFECMLKNRTEQLLDMNTHFRMTGELIALHPYNTVSTHFYPNMFRDPRLERSEMDNELQQCVCMESFHIIPSSIRDCVIFRQSDVIAAVDLKQKIILEVCYDRNEVKQPLPDLDDSWIRV